MGGGKGDVRRGWRAVSGKAGWCVGVKRDVRRGVYGGGNGITTWVLQRRKPALVVGVDVAQHECVATVEESQKRADVEGVSGRAG